MPRRRKGGIVVALNADTSQLKRELGGLNIGKLLKGGVATAGLAAAGSFAHTMWQSADAAAALDTTMRQTFTLMPDMPIRELGNWKDELVEVNKQYGLLTEDSGAALYQAISAGVDASEVFEFMGVAAKTSVGGVATLTESVDTLTSIINAYADAAPEDIVDVNRAADALFTTVRLGKTTIPELASSIAQITAPARGVGLALEEPLAAIAALTAAGVPTSQAATMIRSALQDFTKEGQTLKKFRELTGETVLEFVESGGTLAGVFQIFADEADKTGVAMTDFFGRVEAGMGATLLKDSTRYKEILAEFLDTEGVTDTAFGVMAEGAEFHVSKMSAAWQSMLEKLGTELIPPLIPVVEMATDVVIAFTKWAVSAAKQLVQAWYAAFPLVSAIWGLLTKAWQGYVTLFDWGVENIWAPAINKVAEWGVWLWEEALKPVWEKIKEGWSALVEWLRGLGDTVGRWGAMFGGWLAAAKDALVEFAIWIWGKLKELWGAFQNTREAIWNALQGIWGAIVEQWDKIFPYLRIWGGRFKALFSNLWSWIKTSASGVWEFLKDAGEKYLPPIIEFLGTAIEGFITVLGSLIRGALEAFEKMIDGFQWAWEEVLKPLWENVIEPVAKFVFESVAGKIDFVIDTVKRLAGWAKWLYDNVLKPVWRYALWPIAKFVFNSILGRIELVIEIFKALGTGVKATYDYVLKPILDALNLLLEKTINFFDQLFEKFGIYDLLSGLGGLLGGVVDFVAEGITVRGDEGEEEVDRLVSNWEGRSGRTPGGGKGRDTTGSDTPPGGLTFNMYGNVYGSVDQEFVDMTQEAWLKLAHQNGPEYLPTVHLTR